MSPAVNYSMPTMATPVDNSRPAQLSYFPPPIDLRAPAHPFDTLVKVATQSLTDQK